jgi:glutathione S-transferase
MIGCYVSLRRVENFASESTVITLFGNLDSGNVHKVQMILKHTGVLFRRVDVAQPQGEPRRAEFLKLNPIGKVPAVLLDDGDILSESGAMLYYFAQNTKLWPDDRRTQTEVLRWLFFEQYSHEPALAVMRYLRHYVEDPRQHSVQVQALEPKARHTLGVMENRLQNAAWIAAQDCTIADYALYPYTRMADQAGVDLSDFPVIRAWLARFETQPRFLPMLSDGALETLSFSEYFQATG